MYIPRSWKLTVKKLLDRRETLLFSKQHFALSLDNFPNLSNDFFFTKPGHFVQASKFARKKIGTFYTVKKKYKRLF